MKQSLSEVIEETVLKAREMEDKRCQRQEKWRTRDASIKACLRKTKRPCHMSNSERTEKRKTMQSARRKYSKFKKENEVTIANQKKKLKQKYVKSDIIRSRGIEIVNDRQKDSAFVMLMKKTT